MTDFYQSLCSHYHMLAIFTLYSMHTVHSTEQTVRDGVPQCNVLDLIFLECKVSWYLACLQSYHLMLWNMREQFWRMCRLLISMQLQLNWSDPHNNMNIGLYKHDSEYIFTKRFPSITGGHIYYTYTTHNQQSNQNSIWTQTFGFYQKAHWDWKVASNSGLRATWSLDRKDS